MKANHFEVSTVRPDLNIEKVLVDNCEHIRLFRYSNVLVDPNDGLIFRGISLAHREQLSVDRIKYRFPNPLSVLKKPVDEQRCFHLLGKNSRSYGHFIFEQLPRLLRYYGCNGRFNRSHILLVQPECRVWLDDLLDVLDLGNPSIADVSKSMKVKELLYVDPPRNNFAVFNAIDRKYLLEVLQEPSKPREKKQLFLSRRSATKRSVLNEDELLDVTTSVFPEIEKVDLADVSFEEELCLIQSFQSCYWSFRPEFCGARHFTMI